MNRPFFLYPLFVLHLFLGVGGLFGGGMLLLKPDGSLLGMQLEWLEHSPFKDYLMPGFILFTFNGVLPLFTFTGLLLKPGWKWPDTLNIYRNRHWGWTYSLYSGIIVIAWITVQLIMTQYFWLQPVMIFTGLLIIICTMTPAVMKAYEL